MLVRECRDWLKWEGLRTWAAKGGSKQKQVQMTSSSDFPWTLSQSKPFLPEADFVVVVTVGCFLLQQREKQLIHRQNKGCHRSEPFCPRPGSWSSPSENTKLLGRIKNLICLHFPCPNSCLQSLWNIHNQHSQRREKAFSNKKISKQLRVTYLRKSNKNHIREAWESFYLEGLPLAIC